MTILHVLSLSSTSQSQPTQPSNSLTQECLAQLPVGVSEETASLFLDRSYERARALPQIFEMSMVAENFTAPSEVSVVFCGLCIAFLCVCVFCASYHIAANIRDEHGGGT
jgi:hypothetical protein